MRGGKNIFPQITKIQISCNVPPCEQCSLLWFWLVFRFVRNCRWAKMYLSSSGIHVIVFILVEKVYLVAPHNIHRYCSYSDTSNIFHSFFLHVFILYAVTRPIVCLYFYFVMFVQYHVVGGIFLYKQRIISYPYHADIFHFLFKIQWKYFNFSQFYIRNINKIPHVTQFLNVV